MLTNTDTSTGGSTGGDGDDDDDGGNPLTPGTNTDNADYDYDYDHASLPQPFRLVDPDASVPWMQDGAMLPAPSPPPMQMLIPPVRA